VAKLRKILLLGKLNYAIVGDRKLPGEQLTQILNSLQWLKDTAYTIN
jgi:hypothetical protein